MNVGEGSQATGYTKGPKRGKWQVCEKQLKEGKATCSGCEHSRQPLEGSDWGRTDVLGQMWVLKVHSGLCAQGREEGYRESSEGCSCSYDLTQQFLSYVKQDENTVQTKPVHLCSQWPKGEQKMPTDR